MDALDIIDLLIVRTLFPLMAGAFFGQWLVKRRKTRER